MTKQQKRIGGCREFLIATGLAWLGLQKVYKFVKLNASWFAVLVFYVSPDSVEQAKLKISPLQSVLRELPLWSHAAALGPNDIDKNMAAFSEYKTSTTEGSITLPEETLCLKFAVS